LSPWTFYVTAQVTQEAIDIHTTCKWCMNVQNVMLYICLFWYQWRYVGKRNTQ
jgi:hypothetical protein